MTTDAPARGRDPALDGLRGLAALAVLFDHVGHATVAGLTAPSWLTWFADSRTAVMVFFLLSGYVIGLTCPRGEAAGRTGNYVRRRVVRLLPITLIAVLLTCAVSPPPAAWIALANVLFLQNFAPYGGITIPVLPGNENLWSLNYEAVYYACFILLWRFDPKPARVGALALVVAIVGWYTGLLPLFVACYAAGFLFWGAGLALAWHAPASPDDRANWPSVALLLVLTCKLRGLLNVLAGFPIPLFDGPVVMLYYLDFLPVSVWLVALITRRRLPFPKFIKTLSVLMPLVGLAIKWEHPGYFTALDYRIAVGTYLLALALWNWRPSLQFFRLLAPVGSIAFALYAVARPIQTFYFGHAAWFPQGYVGYALCALATIVSALGVAWVLERLLQPQLNRWLLPGRNRAKSVAD